MLREAKVREDHTKDLVLTLEATSLSTIKWWVDASFAVHKDCRSHTGATMTLGKGCPINISTKQKLNTTSSTVAELVGVSDAMSIILWTRLFLKAQGFEVKDNIVYQDNQSAILLENNGKRSSGKRTRHIDIRYFFVTDNVRQGNITITYCPTGDMVGDFHTKPVQGSLFRRHRATIMNLAPSVSDDGQLQRAQECVEVEGKGSKNDKECSKAAGQRTYAEVAKSIENEDRESSVPK